MAFDVEVTDEGKVVVEMNLTITTPDLADAQWLMRRMRELATAGSRSVAAGDFITTISIPDEEP